jgi:type I site-specific restriction-modification system R (restriction) subunit
MGWEDVGRQLADALAAGKKIVVCTIQTFPFAIDAVRDLAASKGKRFAVTKPMDRIVSAE